MPAYITHAIMGEVTYKLLLKNNYLKIPVNSQAIKTFSLGVDLANRNSRHAEMAHNKDTGLLFLIMIDYIKKNKLYNNANVMAFLYGHIFHYFLDKNTHPYIYYMEMGLKKVGLISTHVFFEGVIDSYLSREILETDIFSLNGVDYCLSENVSDITLREMLDYSYKKLYQIKNMSDSYNYILNIFKTLERIVKSKLCSNHSDGVKKILLVDEYFNMNNLNSQIILNLNNDLWLHPVTGEEHTESFEQLFNKSIEESIEAIEIVNSVIYAERSIDKIYSLFPNISYDTGIDCNYGRQFKYKRKK